MPRPENKKQFLNSAGGFPGLLSALLLLADGAALLLSTKITVPATLFIQTHLLHRPLYDSLSPDALLHRNIYIVLAGLVLLLLWNGGLYTRRVPWWSQVRLIGKAVFFAFLLHGFTNFALKFYESRLLILLIWACAFGLLLIFRRTVFIVAARLHWARRKSVIISDNSTAVDLMYALESDPSTGYTVDTLLLRDPDFTSFDRDSLPLSSRNIKIMDGRDGCNAFIRENPDCFYMISPDLFRGKARDELIKALEKAGAGYAIVPATGGINIYDMDPHYFFGQDITLLEARTSRLNSPHITAQKALKRMADILIASVAIIALLPVFAAVAAALKIQGQGGSVFYGGYRIGRGGKPFRCWKFRSMEPDSDHLLEAYLEANPDEKTNWEKYRKLKNDPRITTAAASLIRKTSIDELPQLWNVLTGDMSLVGPRPILEEEIPYFGESIHDYLSVRPGITGLWQVSGRNETTFAQRVIWDRWYVRNWSLWGDAVILIKTPLVLLSRKGAN